MTLSIRSAEADQLARQLAAMEQTTITKAVVIALKDAVKARRRREDPLETADRILKKHGLTRQPGSHVPVPQSVYHDMDHDLIGEDD